MSPEITLDDYEKIGTMETALSDHADEAFFELSAERQKIAEKIFKCLTETDRENREIRRAMTIKKLCAVAEADFTDVESVIEKFREEGRTFLMPPPEVPLTLNSLVDISHESLIRKWERLKKWVEEEGQSARTYRRLAEDALLHQQGKMGFWSDPELKDALEWRENFKPNETWAQLYKETGERQYRASFEDSMRYLDESEITRDREIAEDERQQNALRKYARNLRWTVIGLVFFSILSIGAAVFAFNLRAETIRVNSELVTEKNITEVSLQRLEESQKNLKLEQQNKDKAFEELAAKKEELSVSLEKQEEATEKAEIEKLRADKEADQAKLSEAEKQKALEVQKRLAEEAKDAEKKAEERRLEASEARIKAERELERANATSSREEINRKALVFLEQGEYERALPEFKNLLGHYENETEQMTDEARSDGKWWALHNLGIVNSRLPNTDDYRTRFRDAECAYLKALKLLGENLDPKDYWQCPPSGAQNPREYFQQNVSYQNRDEIMRNKVTTLRRLAQFYRERAENTTQETEAAALNRLAKQNYEKLLEILPQETIYEKQPTYPADVYVELADALVDLNGWINRDRIWELYDKARNTYSIKKEFVKEVAVRKKMSEYMLNYDFKSDGAVELLEETLKIQVDKNRMSLPPIDAEIADSYYRLSRAWQAKKDRNKADVFEKLADMVSDLEYEINKPDGFDVDKFEALANAYLEIRKCERAKEVFTYGIKQNRENVNFAQYILSRAARFHQDRLRDKNGAKTYFDDFYKAFKEYPENLFTPQFLADYQAAGDFYLAGGDYAKAKELYERGLQISNVDLNKFEKLLLEEKESSKTVASLKTQRDTAKLPYIEMITKIARVSEAQNQFAEAEAKYTEAENLITNLIAEQNKIPTTALTGQTVEDSIYQVKLLISIADFYARRKNEEKAESIYKMVLEYNFGPGDLLIRKLLGYLVHTGKKLGDINRNNAKVAAEYYSLTLKELRDLKTFIADSQNPLKEDNLPYIKNNALTAKFYTDLAEVLESLASLDGVADAAKLKSEAHEARELAKKAAVEEQKPPCAQ